MGFCADCSSPSARACELAKFSGIAGKLQRQSGSVRWGVARPLRGDYVRATPILFGRRWKCHATRLPRIRHSSGCSYREYQEVFQGTPVC